MSEQKATVNRNRKDMLIEHVAETVSNLQAASLSVDHPRNAVAIGALADLRRADPGEIGDPRVWEVVFDGMPEPLLGRGDDPSESERAAHAAIVLFAIHEQSANARSHRRGRGLGRAIQDLAREANGDEWQDGSIARRFRTMALTDGREERLRHLRGLITLLRSYEIPLDYGQLAWDLVVLERPDRSMSVLARWGREFHSNFTKKSDNPPKESADVR